MKKLGNTFLCKFDVHPNKCFEFEVDLKQNGEELNIPLFSESKLLTVGSGPTLYQNVKQWIWI